jgi:hypothetical protein
MFGILTGLCVGGEGLGKYLTQLIGGEGHGLLNNDEEICWGGWQGPDPFCERLLPLGFWAFWRKKEEKRGESEVTRTLIGELVSLCKHCDVPTASSTLHQINKKI